MNTGDNIELNNPDENNKTIIEIEIEKIDEHSIVEIAENSIVEIAVEPIKSSNLKQTICLSISAILFLLVGNILLFIFDIIGLVTTTINDVYNKCSTSNIWSYVLVSLIIGSINLYFQGTKRKNEVICNDIIVLAECITMFIWGAYELFGNTCVDKLNDTILFKVALCHWIVSILCTSIIVFSILLCLFK
jgi:hypothetical protein